MNNDTEPSVPVEERISGGGGVNAHPDDLLCFDPLIRDAVAVVRVKHR